MAKLTIKVGVKIKWWVHPLLSTLVFLKRMGFSFNEDDISERIIKHGVIPTLDGKRIAR